jgi:shikimate 5-dehydrogenase
MWPGSDETPMPAESLAGCRLVFDMIYRPMATRLLRDAARQGCDTLNGLDMFWRQAAVQFELWFHRSPDVVGGRALLQSLLEKESPA